MPACLPACLPAVFCRSISSFAFQFASIEFPSPARIVYDPFFRGKPAVPSTCLHNQNKNIDTEGTGDAPVFIVQLQLFRQTFLGSKRLPIQLGFFLITHSVRPQSPTATRTKPTSVLILVVFPSPLTRLARPEPDCLLLHRLSD